MLPHISALTAPSLEFRLPLNKTPQKALKTLSAEASPCQPTSLSAHIPFISLHGTYNPKLSHLASFPSPSLFLPRPHHTHTHLKNTH